MESAMLEMTERTHCGIVAPIAAQRFLVHGFSPCAPAVEAGTAQDEPQMEQYNISMLHALKVSVNQLLFFKMFSRSRMLLSHAVHFEVLRKPQRCHSKAARLGLLLALKCKAKGNGYRAH